MSATAGKPLGGFEERLLSELKAHVASRPQPAAPPTAHRTIRAPRLTWPPRLPIPAIAAITAVLVAALSLLPAATPTLAQAFPILTERARTLPASLYRLLKEQALATTDARFDPSDAYAFRTATGTGYVVVDQRTRWLCILVPGITGDTAGSRCASVSLVRTGQRQLAIRIALPHRSGQQIVALLPNGATASIAGGASASHALTVTRGVLTVTTRGPATITTTVQGRRSSTTYVP